MIELRKNNLDHDTQLFVYGSLMFDEVIRSLIGRVPSKKAAYAWDCERLKICDRVYPALKLLGKKSTNNNTFVSGYIYTGIKEEEYRIIDKFEDERYQINAVNTSVGEALCYSSTGCEFQYCGVWDPDEFKGKYFENYISMCENFALEYERNNR